MATYLDSSALVKLGRREDESQALRRYLDGQPVIVTSVISRAEVRRALRRANPSDGDVAADQALAQVDLVPLDLEIIESAGRMAPPELRALDALHLATALSVGVDMRLVTYDSRLAEAAEAAGVTVEAPR